MNPYAGMRAFTLIELIITVAIAAILLVIATPSFTNLRKSGRSARKLLKFAVLWSWPGESSSPAPWCGHLRC